MKNATATNQFSLFPYVFLLENFPFPQFSTLPNNTIRTILVSVSCNIPNFGIAKSGIFLDQFLRKQVLFYVCSPIYALFLIPTWPIFGFDVLEYTDFWNYKIWYIWALGECIW